MPAAKKKVTPFTVRVPPIDVGVKHSIDGASRDAHHLCDALIEVHVDAAKLPQKLEDLAAFLRGTTDPMDGSAMVLVLRRRGSR